MNNCKQTVSIELRAGLSCVLKPATRAFIRQVSRTIWSGLDLLKLRGDEVDHLATDITGGVLRVDVNVFDT